MHPNTLLPLASSLLSFLFAGLVLDQYRRRRRPHQLAWTVGLLLCATSVGAEFLGGAFGWSVALYRWWYLLGATGVAAYLGLGTLYLLARTGFGWLAVGALVVGALPAALGGYLGVGAPGLLAAAALALIRWQRPAWFAHAFALATVLGSLAAAAAVFGAPVDPGALPTGPEQAVTGQGFPGGVRIITPLFNITGASALSLGAGYSAYRFWRTRVMPHRLASNALIAVGAFVPGATAGLSRFGVTSALPLGELLGVVLIFAGFLLGAEGLAATRVPLLGAVLRSGRRPEGS